MAVGSRLGAFDLVAPIGRGGHAAVWRAVHRSSGQRVAVKVLIDRPEGAAALRAEVRAIASLDHPNIVQVVGMGEAGDGEVAAGAPWFAMELATGTLPSGVHDAEGLRDALERVLGALAHAHARGLLHLDVKPANVLVGCPSGADEVASGPLAGLRLSDFGVARRWRTAPSGSGWQGTPAYMAPEQLRGEPRRFGPWTDVYALGHLAWQLATGQRALVGPTAEVVRLQLAGVWPPFVPRFTVPARLVDWVQWCLARRPEARPALARRPGRPRGWRAARRCPHPPSRRARRWAARQAPRRPRAPGS